MAHGVVVLMLYISTSITGRISINNVGHNLGRSTVQN
jgi:hypothetical protein